MVQEEEQGAVEKSEEKGCGAWQMCLESWEEVVRCPESAFPESNRDLVVLAFPSRYKNEKECLTRSRHSVHQSSCH